VPSALMLLLLHANMMGGKTPTPAHNPFRRRSIPMKYLRQLGRALPNVELDNLYAPPRPMSAPGIASSVIG